MGVEVLEPLAGGARNSVLIARRGSERLVIRVSGRAPDCRAWELDLLDAFAAAGIVVPRSVPTGDTVAVVRAAWRPVLDRASARSTATWGRATC